MMDYKELVSVIKQRMEGLFFWMLIFFVITHISTCGVESRIIEELKNHEKTMINMIREAKNIV